MNCTRGPRSGYEVGTFTGAGGTRPRVLLAEDSDTARALMKALLEQMGCSVDDVGDGHEAVERASHAAYDAILMDIEMPVLDGLSAALEIRRRDTMGVHTPIIALSALIADISSRPVLAAAFDAAIAKPVRRCDLYRILHTHIAPPRQDAGGPPAAAPRTDNVAPEPIDFAEQDQIFGSIRHAERCALMKLAIREFAELTRQLGAAARAGSCRDVRHIAHRIRGTAANFAAMPLAHTAAALECDCAVSLPADIAARIAALGSATDATIAALNSRCCSEPRERPAEARASG